MGNINTSRFWDKKIKGELKQISKSPIYNHKNRIVVDWLRGFNGKLVNLGVGYGILEDLLVKNNPKVNLFGVDISKTAINKIRSKVGGEFYIKEASKTIFDNEYFDCVLALDILEHLHLKHLDKVLIEIRRVLINNGIFIVSVPLNEPKNDKKLNRHLISFTEQSIKELLKRFSFELIKVKLLYAFKNWYLIKTLVTGFMKLKKPNLIVIYCKKNEDFDVGTA